MNGVQINAALLGRCIETLEYGMEQLERHDRADIAYDFARAGCVKEFEIVLEQSGKLLRMRLRDYFVETQQADRLFFNDAFRYAAKHGLMGENAVERWLHYREKRNFIAHEYGENFSEDVLNLLPGFVKDAKALLETIGDADNE